MSFSSYDEALAFWYARVNYEQRSARPSDLKLDRMRSLLRLLGEPQERLRIIHVAGSKGKGSTAALLASILRQAGYRTGLFTSPHLSRVEERIQVDGDPISRGELTSILSDVADAVAKLDGPTAVRPTRPLASRVEVASWATRVPTTGSEPPPAPVTFFEVATAAGFLHFIRRRVDVAVLEVGLGGRFDSTNVCQPLIAVLTSISLDHVQQLGSRLASIAWEKAGIVKRGRPVVSGATVLEAREVIEAICRERQAPLRQLSVDFRYSYEAGQVTAAGTRPSRVQIFSDRRAWPLLELALLGEHQAGDAALAVACIEHLRTAGWAITDRAVAAGLSDVVWPARLEVAERQPLLVLDCAHNVASAQALVDALRQSFPATRRLLVFAVSNDKDVEGMFRVLAPHFAHAVLTSYRGSRSVPTSQLATLLRSVADLPHTVADTPTEALKIVRSLAGPKDLICVAGSVFLAGEMRALLVSA